MEYKKGRGAQINTRNKFLRDEKTRENVESVDDWTDFNAPTQYIEQESKSIVNKVRLSTVTSAWQMVQHESLPGLRTRMHILLCAQQP